MQDELSPESVLGVDNITLDLPIAGVGSRVLAAGIDYVLLAAATLFAFLLIPFLLGVAGGSGAWVVALMIAAPFVLSWSYFIGSEVFFFRTIGKNLVGLRVVGRQGGTPSRGAIVLRNLLREIDLFLGVPLIFADSRSRRLGDRVGGTLVVHDRHETSSVAIGRMPASWGAREAAVVEALLRRASEMDPDRCEALARRIVKMLERDAPELLPPAADVNHPLVTLRQALHVRQEP